MNRKYNHYQKEGIIMLTNKGKLLNICSYVSAIFVFLIGLIFLMNFVTNYPFQISSYNTISDFVISYAYSLELYLVYFICIGISLLYLLFWLIFYKLHYKRIVNEGAICSSFVIVVNFIISYYGIEFNRSPLVFIFSLLLINSFVILFIYMCNKNGYVNKNNYNKLLCIIILIVIAISVVYLFISKEIIFGFIFLVVLIYYLFKRNSFISLSLICMMIITGLTLVLARFVNVEIINTFSNELYVTPYEIQTLIDELHLLNSIESIDLLKNLQINQVLTTGFYLSLGLIIASIVCIIVDVLNQRNI